MPRPKRLVGVSAATGMILGILLSGCEPTGTKTQPSAPVVPPVVSLGEREFGEAVIASFEICNSLDQPLEITGFRKTCACGAVEAEENGQYAPVERLVVPPKSKRGLRMAMVVGGEVGGKSRQRLDLVTNDAVQPVRSVEFVVERVLGTAYAAPARIAFGRVLQGTAIEHEVEVRDPSLTPRNVARISVSHPDRIAVRSQSAQEEEKTDHPLGRLKARLFVRMDSSRPGSVSGTITVDMEGPSRRSLEIDVSGQIVAAIQPLPRDVVLPRMTSQGKLYAAELMLQSNVGEIMAVSWDNLPAGVSLEHLATQENRAHLRVSVEPASLPAGGKEKQISLNVKTPDREHTVSFSILSFQ